MTTQTNIENRGWREHLYHFIDNEEEQNFGSQLFEVFITVLILLSIISIILESFESLREGNFAYFQLLNTSGELEMQRVKIVDGYGELFDLFENITLIIFALEYIARIITADFKYKEEVSSPWQGAKRFIKSGSGIVDLVAISPLVFVLSDIDFRFIRVLKISRLFRVFKLSTLTRSIVIVGDVFVEKAGELGITMFVTFVLLLVSATLMWYVEGDAQPEVFPNIIATFWWAIATLTTVGYGDVFPITAGGKVLSGVIAILGIGMVALPAGILSSAFIEKLEDPNASNSGEEAQEDEKDADTLIQEEKIANEQQEEIVVNQQTDKILDSKEKSGQESINEDTTVTDPPLKISESKQVKLLDDDKDKLTVTSVSSYQQHILNTNCIHDLGKPFVYCPYCGKKLEEGHKH
ncbi:MAG: ion transporter [Saprospiraceae bacterium]|nr:ion transporter [Saprospiraceae bacterium]